MPEIPECCKECVKWDKFSKDCWVYWELKKECTLHAKDWDEVNF